MSSSNFSLLSLTLLLNVLSFIPNFASASVKEETALLKWKASLQIPNNSQIISSWTPRPMNSNATALCSSWFGIVCNADGNIYRLNLTTSELNGTLLEFPFSILHNLTHFELSVNNFFGPIPPEIGLLSKLVYLDFSANQFSSSIPPEIGMLANLETLHLNENYFNGSIPREIGQLTSLKELALYSNSLQGELPTTLGNLRKLAYLYLDDNKLSGQIPREFGQLVNLLEVYITDNFLEGPIPPTIGKLSKLTVLHLFNNKLTGSIPHEMGSMGVRFTCEGTIMHLNTNKDWYYKACSQCTVKVTCYNNIYECREHGIVPAPNYRYNFRATITDNTATSQFTFFTPKANEYGDPRQFPEELYAIVGKNTLTQPPSNLLTPTMTGINIMEQAAKTTNKSQQSELYFFFPSKQIPEQHKGTALV
ncbi:leucine-rich repeat receptor-like protein kinase family protein [Artemisia annua]|uniref:Leucine-rich repeat receptor-like protein kinase family protein n=1 Tax=Artemisia annua TaxID=35608 RepID=A0A2U1NLS1_ARTAN|nr:leucine-rich repeat receptor-like protein kinase family protein [Artemisia annua]